MPAPELRGTNSGAAPIVPQRGTGEAQALTGMASMFNSMARSTSSASSTFDENEMSVLTEAQEAYAMLETELANNERGLQGAGVKASTMLAGFLRDPRVQGNKALITVLTGMKKATLGGTQFSIDQTLELEKQKAVQAEYFKYGLSPDIQKDRELMAEITSKKAERLINKTNLESLQTERQVNEEKTRAGVDKDIQGLASDLRGLMDGNLVLTTQGEAVGINDPAGKDGFKLPKPAELANLQEKDKAQIFAVLGQYVQSQKDYYSTLTGVDSEWVNNQIKGVENQIESYKKLVNGGYQKEQYDVVTELNNSIFKYELSAPELQMSRHIIDMVAKNMTDDQRMVFWADKDNRKLYSDAVGFLSNSLLGIDLSGAKDGDAKKGWMAIAGDLTGGFFKSGDYGDMDDADFKALHRVIQLNVLPMLDPNAVGVGSTQGLSPVGYDKLLDTFSDKTAMKNFLSYRTPKETRDGIVNLMVTYGGKIGQKAVADIPEGFVFDPKTYTISGGKGMTGTAQEVKWNQRYSKRLQQTVNFLAEVEGTDANDALTMLGMAPKADTPNKGQPAPTITIPDDAPQFIKDAIKEDPSLFKTQEDVDLLLQQVNS